MVCGQERLVLRQQEHGLPGDYFVPAFRLRCGVQQLGERVVDGQEGLLLPDNEPRLPNNQTTCHDLPAL